MPLDHITVPTRCFETTVKFFRYVVEFPVIDSPTDIPMRACWFDAGNGQSVHVVEIEGEAETANEREFGRHIAFGFPLARWLRIKNQLERANIEIVPPLRPSTVSRFFVYD